MRGYFGIGVINPKHEENVGTLWRAAHIFRASYIYTINRRYRRQSSDTSCAWAHVPMYHYDSFDQFYSNMPHGCVLAGIEMGPEGTPIENYVHLPRVCYLLGSEDGGIPPYALARCHNQIYLPGKFSMNVAMAGTCVLYDRKYKHQRNEYSQPRVA